FIRVPLDHADTNKGTISLQMAHIPASQQPSKGGIFFSPGEQGVVYLASKVDELVQKCGPDWDIISWDIRGTLMSEPYIQDILPDERDQIWGQTIHPGQFESHGNLTTDADAAFLSV
ncbi:hypothetical protein CPB86DRAFT_712142, partial [Serendipita vermifera]